MPALVATVVLVGLISLGNLLLCFGIIRRLRTHTEILNERATAPFMGGLDGSLIAEAGSTVDEFSVLTVDGSKKSRDDLTATTLVGFFADGCPGCKEQLPSFLELAAGMPGGRERVLAVVLGSGSPTAEPLVAELSVVATMVDGDGDAIREAFGVEGYPAYALVDAAGTVLASGLRTGALAGVRVG